MPHISLKVPSNSIVALLGTNGAGKSTTVRAISGFLPVDDAEIKKGTIQFDGHSTSIFRRTVSRDWYRSGAGAPQNLRH